MPENTDAGPAPLLMIGNPNVGKSALFNRLTGGNAVVSNYPGTTVDYTRGMLMENGRCYDVTDVPGTYSLEARDAAEEVAVSLLAAHPGAVVMVVLDATRVERGLYLALEVIERGYPVIIALNMIDAAHDRHVLVDAAGLQRILGVPVVPTSAVTGEGLSTLAASVCKARQAEIGDVVARAEGREMPVPVRCSGCGRC